MSVHKNIGFINWLMNWRQWMPVRCTQKAPFVSLSKKVYLHFSALVGSRKHIPSAHFKALDNKSTTYNTTQLQSTHIKLWNNLASFHLQRIWTHNYPKLDTIVFLMPLHLLFVSKWLEFGTPFPPYWSGCYFRSHLWYCHLGSGISQASSTSFQFSC